MSSGAGHKSSSRKHVLTEATKDAPSELSKYMADITMKPASPSQHTHVTEPSTLRSISMRSSLSSHAYGAQANSNRAASLEDVHVRPLPENPYCFEESDEEEDREKKAAKKHKKKKKKSKKHKQKRRPSNESSEKQSSRRTKDSADSHRKRRSSAGSDRHREHRHQELEPLDEMGVSPRKHRRDRKKQSEGLDDFVSGGERRRSHDDEPDDDDMLKTSDEFLRNRRERRGRMREDAIEMETVERRERRERHERRREEAIERSGRRHHHHHVSSVGGSHHHHQHHHSNSSHRPQRDSRPQTGRPEDIQFKIPFPGDVEHAAASIPVPQQRTPSRAAELWSPRTRREMQVPTTISVPTNIDVVVDKSHEDMEAPRSERPRRTKSDYDRLRQLLHEQSDKSDSESSLSEERSKVLDKLHPLIAASDQEFQEAFDNLAKDSVFDDNFEKAFNEFSEHYLALSPWGEDDSTGMKDKCDQPTGQEEFIQIPLTPVSRKGITSYIAKDDKYYTTENGANGTPRTPVVERGYLTPSDLDSKLRDLKKKESQHSLEDFVEVSRTPYTRKSSQSPSPECSEDKSKQVQHDSSHSSSRARSEPCEKASDEHRRQKWGILRGRRQTSKTTV